MAGLWTEERRKEKKTRKKEKVAETERQNVLKTLMSTYGGRQFVHNILYGSGVFAPTFSTNGLSMAYNEGQRYFGLRFLADINESCPEKYSLMIREYNERSTDDSNRTSDSTTGSEHPGGEDAGGPVEGGDGTVDPDAPDPHGYYIGHYRP